MPKPDLSMPGTPAIDSATSGDPNAVKYPTAASPSLPTTDAAPGVDWTAEDRVHASPKLHEAPDANPKKPTQTAPGVDGTFPSDDSFALSQG